MLFYTQLVQISVLVRVSKYLNGSPVDDCSADGIYGRVVPRPAWSLAVVRDATLGAESAPASVFSSERTRTSLG